MYLSCIWVFRTFDVKKHSCAPLIRKPEHKKQLIVYENSTLFNNDGGKSLRNMEQGQMMMTRNCQMYLCLWIAQFFTGMSFSSRTPRGMRLNFKTRRQK